MIYDTLHQKAKAIFPTLRRTSLGKKGKKWLFKVYAKYNHNITVNSIVFEQSSALQYEGLEQNEYGLILTYSFGKLK